MAKTVDPQMMIDFLEARAALYGLLSNFCLEKPGSTCKVLGFDLRNSELKEAFQKFDMETGHYLEKLEQYFRNNSLLSLAAEDFDRLFQPGEISFVRPYESYYLSQDRFRLPKLMGKRPELEVDFFYRHAGLDMNALYQEKGDHAGVELAFMKELMLKEVQARQNGQTPFAQCYVQWQIQFMENHLLRWLSELGKQVELKASTDFYRTIAKLLKHFPQVHFSFLNQVV